MSPLPRTSRVAGFRSAATDAVESQSPSARRVRVRSVRAVDAHSSNRVDSTTYVAAAARRPIEVFNLEHERAGYMTSGGENIDDARLSVSQRHMSKHGTGWSTLGSRRCHVGDSAHTIDSFPRLLVRTTEGGRLGAGKCDQPIRCARRALL